MSVFTKSAFKKPNQSTFNLSHSRVFTADMGKLIPVLCQPVLPGDKWNLNSNQMLRMMPMIAPVMHEINVVIHYWYVPNRIVWNNFKTFMTGGDTGQEEPPLPTVKNLPIAVNSLADYLGLPITNNLTEEISILPFLAYQKIYNEFYRDQNLQEEIDIDDFVEGTNIYGSDTINGTIFNLRKRAWNHDYFTSALPFAQKGIEVMLPLISQDLDPVKVDFNPSTVGTQYLYDRGTTPATKANNYYSIISQGDGQTLATEDATGDPKQVVIDNSDFLEVDLDALQASAASIRDLRIAIATQEFLEKNARGGTRYIEQLLVHWGVISSDGRLQRPEFLGGSKSPIMVSEVLQNSATQSNTTPQGNLAGHGMNLGGTTKIYKRFEEHGYIIGIMSIMPKTMYMQGIPRDWTKLDRLDFGFPEFEHIGEQNILNKEILHNHQNPDDTFGYIPRYSEYKYINNSVHGDLRGNLDFWHLGRKFDPENPPQLNGEFIECNPRTDIFAVQDENYPRFVVNMYHDINAQRPFSYYSNPKLL